ncbi:MAG: ribonuclease III [Ruminococcaceae bacterium]|nr:ribonuclease III [Oscillospiraceae bacterium]
MQNTDISLLERAIGYTFKDKRILKEALTHSSYAHELRSKRIETQCNERLEFLGDSVLSIVTSEYLFSKYTDLPEGDLTHMRAALVQSQALAKYARGIGLGQFLYVGNGEERNRDQQSILEDAFEALLAAMYLDAAENGLDVIRAFLLPIIKKELEENSTRTFYADAKTELQQLTQISDGATPVYRVIGESGPDHQKTFEVEVMLNSNVIGHGKGRSKREAEQNAAREALELFGV